VPIGPEAPVLNALRMADTAFTYLRSPRLTLRRLQAGELAYFCEYRSNPEVACYQSWDTFTPADGERLLEQQSVLYPDVEGTWFQMVIVLTASGALVGDCGLHCRQDDPRQGEIGITLAPEHQGKGYAVEALGCVLDYVFFTLGKHRITAITDADNAAAARLLERVGFRREGHFIRNIWFKGKWGDEFLYAILHAEWEQNQRTLLSVRPPDLRRRGD